SIKLAVPLLFNRTRLTSVHGPLTWRAASMEYGAAMSPLTVRTGNRMDNEGGVTESGKIPLWKIPFPPTATKQFAPNVICERLPENGLPTQLTPSLDVQIRPG